MYITRGVLLCRCGNLYKAVAPKPSSTKKTVCPSCFHTARIPPNLSWERYKAK